MPEASGRHEYLRAFSVRVAAACELNSSRKGHTCPGFEEACLGVSRDMVPLVLGAMKSVGQIESTGMGRGKVFRVNQVDEK